MGHMGTNSLYLLSNLNVNLKTILHKKFNKKSNCLIHISPLKNTALYQSLLDLVLSKHFPQKFRYLRDLTEMYCQFYFLIYFNQE